MKLKYILSLILVVGTISAQEEYTAEKYGVNEVTASCENVSSLDQAIKKFNSSNIKLGDFIVSTIKVRKNEGRYSNRYLFFNKQSFITSIVVEKSTSAPILCEVLKKVVFSKAFEKLEDAREDFSIDNEMLDNLYNITAYIPSALNYKERTTKEGKNTLYVSVMQCYKKGGYTTSEIVSESLQVPTVEYIPGKTDYTDSYKKGDLWKAIFENKKLVKRILDIYEVNKVMPDCQNDLHLNYKSSYQRTWEKIIDLIKIESNLK